MAKQVQQRRGTTTEHSTFTGAVGEVTVDITKDTAVVHDGSTVGGHPLAKEANVPNGANSAITDTGTNVGIGTSSPSAVSHIYKSSSGSNVQIIEGSASNTGSNTQYKNLYSGGLYVGINGGTTGDAIFNNSANSATILSTNNTERMRIDSSGNVGIGTSSPSTKLHTKGEITLERTIEASNKSTIGTEGNFSFKASSTATGDVQDRNMTFFTSNTERMRIDTSGRALFSQTTATHTSSTMGISGSTGAEGAVVTINHWGNGASNRDFIRFYNKGSEAGSIEDNTTSVAFRTTSDYRLKENFEEINNGIERLMALHPLRFSFIKDEDSKMVDGFIAHEAQAVVPEAVSGTKDGMIDEEYEVTPAVYETVEHPAIEEELDAEGNVVVQAQESYTEEVLVAEAVMGTRAVPRYQGIDQAKLVPLLTKALQEAVERIEALEAKVNAI